MAGIRKQAHTHVHSTIIEKSSGRDFNIQTIVELISKANVDFCNNIHFSWMCYLIFTILVYMYKEGLAYRCDFLMEAWIYVGIQANWFTY